MPDTTTTDPWAAPTAAYDVTCLRAGLEVIAAPGCTLYGPTSDCWAHGRLADGQKRRTRACPRCVAARVLAGQHLPCEADGA